MGSTTPSLVLTNDAGVASRGSHVGAASAGKNGDWVVLAAPRDGWADVLRAVAPGERYAAIERRAPGRILVVVHAIDASPVVHVTSADDLKT
jgi:hypothetical protein